MSPAERLETVSAAVAEIDTEIKSARKLLMQSLSEVDRAKRAVTICVAQLERLGRLRSAALAVIAEGLP